MFVSYSQSVMNYSQSVMNYSQSVVNHLQMFANVLQTFFAKYRNAKQNHPGCKMCKANQKQIVNRYVRPKTLISAEAKILFTYQKIFLST